MYRVILSHDAQRFFDDADAPLQRKLDRCFDMLKIEPHRHPNIKPLKGRLSGYYRYRVGDYRVVFRIDAQSRVVYVPGIEHRSGAYR
ncbi:MAG: type II toxin-antitoxin system RelE/ParE family toxin [Planctomycetes bacterium]|nr:type II toxin-antitoxin system RelE/ParE family toxin [Planctomycetota bacterium]